MTARDTLLIAAALLVSTACEPPGKPKPEPSSEDITDFKVLYSENCSGCHGVDGKNGPGRILNDPLYLALIPRDTLKGVIEHGRPGTAMPAWAKSDGGPLTPRQVDALVNGIEQNWAKPDEFQGQQLLSYAGTGQGDADSGRKLFLRNCYMCHGPGAKVGSVTDAAYLSLVTDQMLRTSILVGRPDMGMPDYRHLKLGKALSDADVSDLVAFLGSKRPAQIESAGLNEPAGTGEHGATSRGNEASGNRPGSPRKEREEGNKSTGASSQQGIK